MPKYKQSELCPLCGQFMDIYCTGNRSTPFVDGQTYRKLCFTCFYVPKTQREIYTEDGLFEGIMDLGYGPAHLHTAQELFESGAAETMAQARRSVAAVRAAIKISKVKKKTKFPKPKDPGTELNPDY